jgi:DNA/RNA-binding domain of Phe-tRNA-synthetase-like protein
MSGVDPPPAAPSGGQTSAGGPASAGGEASRRAGQPQLGWCAAEVAQELPQLRLAWVETAVRGGSPARRAPRALRERLRDLSNRLDGARAIAVRREPIPSAYRVLFRQIGLDPDVVRTPVEAAMFARMMEGGFISRSLLDDVLLVALIDTSVPVWALDPATLEPPLGIRLSGERESLGLGSDAIALPAGRLVIADGRSALAQLFGEVASGHRVSGASERVLLCAIQVAGVPWLHIEEALWMCRVALEGPVDF